MAECPFHLTLLQAARITVEYLVFTALASIGVIVTSKLLQSSSVLSESSQWELALGTILGAIWVIARALRRHGVSWSHIAVWRVRPGGLLAPFLVLVIGDGILSCGVDNMLEAIAPMPPSVRELFQELTDPAGQPMAGFVVAVIVAPLTEELVCRGLVLRGLLGSGNASRAILLSSVLFALMHVNPWQILSAFTGGLILGWAYVRTRSLGLCFAGHALHNAIWYLSASLPFEIPGVNSTPAPGQTHFIPWWFALCGVALVVAGATWFHRAAPAARPFLAHRSDDVLATPQPAGATL